MSVEMDPPDMRALSRKLKAAGQGDLGKALNKEINQAVGPLRKAFKASAKKRLPKRGGLADKVSKTRYRTQKNKNGVRLIANNQYELEKLDRTGIVRHPTYGGKPWVAQHVQKGIFTDPWNENADDVKAAVEKAITETIKKIDGEF